MSCRFSRTDVRVLAILANVRVRQHAQAAGCGRALATLSTACTSATGRLRSRRGRSNLLQPVFGRPTGVPTKAPTGVPMLKIPPLEVPTRTADYSSSSNFETWWGVVNGWSGH